MDQKYEDIDYNNIIDSLLSTFGNVLSRDCMFTIVESCGGNLEQSANAILNIVTDNNLPPTPILKSTHSIPNENVTVNDVVTTQENVLNDSTHNKSEINLPGTSSSVGNSVTTENIISYAGASKKVIQPLQKRPPKFAKSASKCQEFWTDQLKQILSYHIDGVRVLIIMRGLSGSGKSYLAKEIVDTIYSEQNKRNYKNHIFSTDDFFMINNRYYFDPSRLSDFHLQNEKRARRGMIQGISPVIIDNTNIELWEMKNYVYEGVKNGYIIEVVEPNTPWSKNAKQLQRNTVHRVPYHTIQRKLEIYQSGVTGAHLIRYFGFHYSSNMTPPVIRLFPPFVEEKPESTMSFENNQLYESQDNNQTKKIESKTIECMHNNYEVSGEIASFVGAQGNQLENSDLKTLTDSKITKNEDNIQNANEDNLNLKFTEFKNSLEEIEKIEEEWENGEGWDDDKKKRLQKDETLNLSDSKPQRNELPRSSGTQKILPSVEEYQDWSKISMFLPSWGECSKAPLEIKPVIEKKSSATCIEIGDTVICNLKNPLKIISTIPRDINEFYVESKSLKIPEKWMLDKSTSTSNNHILTDTQRCENEEQHFNSFRKLFKNIPRSDLRDIFDNCRGDVNWAVDIVLDGMDNQQLGLIETDDVSDAEEEEQNTHLCKCLSAYDILPAHNESSSPSNENERTVNNASMSPINSKKSKKDCQLCETSLQLKRQIEQNVVIPDSHYSENYLKLRRRRYGEQYEEENIDVDKTDTLAYAGINTSDNAKEILGNNITDIAKGSLEDYNIPSTSGLLENYVNDHNFVSSNEEGDIETNDEESHGLDEVTINVNVGSVFIRQLDELFGRGQFNYPPSIEPRMSIRLSLLEELNALWIESIMHQLEENAKQTDLMIKQDEEFARQLTLKGDELLREGKEPAIPNFKEVMDMDYALLLYHRDVDEWRNSVPNDLAAKLTREKLFNLFPEVPNDILTEMLVAYNNNFQSTVEDLLGSTGRQDVLKEPNGVSKFVMQKEIERQEKLLQKEKQVLSDVDWPVLPTLEKVDMETVQRYRNEADRHLQARNTNYQKAQEYIRRGMTQVASYYSEFATFHTMKYEQANSLAAASLLQFHATKCPNNTTIDLHYLRVGEATQTVDLFLDSHIRRLRETTDRNGTRSINLFFITGRGLHSNGKPRVKPAVIKRLRERGFMISERNPGLITTKVSADDRLSHEIA